MQLIDIIIDYSAKLVREIDACEFVMIDETGPLTIRLLDAEQKGLIYVRMRANGNTHVTYRKVGFYLADEHKGMISTMLREMQDAGMEPDYGKETTLDYLANVLAEDENCHWAIQALWELNMEGTAPGLERL